jgi:uncharacterized protein YaeQ
MRARLWNGYLVAAVAAIGGFAFLAEESWARVVWQVAVGALVSAVVIVGMRRHRPRGAAAFYLFGAGVFLNGSGLLVEAVSTKLFGVTATPSLADVFWLAIYPGLVLGMWHLIRHRQAQRDWATRIDTTVIAVGLGLLAWVFIIRPGAGSAGPSRLALIAVVAYPIGDLVVLALMVRLLLGGGERNASFFCLIAAALTLLLVDVGWAIVAPVGRAGPILHLVLSSGSLLAYLLVGAAALHPSVQEIARASPRSERVGPALVVGLAGASLMAPAVLLWQSSHRHVTDGGAIGLCSAVLFLLVVARMLGLLHRLEERSHEIDERNRSARRMLDTINQGLVRVAADGRLFEERSAMIDRWFGAFAGRPRLADYLRPIDAAFADTFVRAQAGLHDRPLGQVLARLPARLRAGRRELSVSYLAVDDGGLLLVIDDITERLALARHQAEQSERLALSQAWSRDREQALRFFDETGARLARAASPEGRDLLVGLEGDLAKAGFAVMARLCREAAQADAASVAREALRARWRQLADLLASFGQLRGDTLEVDARELTELSAAIARGLPPREIAARLSSWRAQGSPPVLSA